MTKKINWVEILEQHEETILEAGRQAYRNACTTVYDNSFSMTEDVIVNKYGNIRTETQQQNWQSQDTWNGDAVCVISFKRFNPWENESEDEAIKNILESDEMLEFKKYLDANEIEYYGRNELRDWNTEIANRVDSEMEQYDIDDHMEEQVQSQFEQCIERLKQENVDYDVEF